MSLYTQVLSKEFKFYAETIAQFSLEITVFAAGAGKKKTKLGKAFLFPEDFQDMRGALSRPIISSCENV